MMMMMAYALTAALYCLRVVSLSLPILRRLPTTAGALPPHGRLVSDARVGRRVWRRGLGETLWEWFFFFSQSWFLLLP